MKNLTFLTAILIASISFAQVPSYVPTSGLFAYYPFNNNGNDLSGYNNHLILNGNIIYTQDYNNQNNSAVHFTNGNNYYTTPLSSWSLINNFNNGSVSFWVNIDSQYISNHYFGIGNSFIVKQKHGVGEDLFFGMQDGTTKIRMQITGVFPSPQGADLISNTSLLINNWYHIVGIWNGNNHKLYINGVLDSEIVNTIGISDRPNPDYFSFGSILYGGNGTTSFPSGAYGSMDDIGIWNRALTDCEIKNLYNGGIPNSSQTQSALDTYTWPVNNQSYTQSGTYSDTLVNAAGCDSIVTLNLTLNYTGLNELSTSTIAISPNPTNGDFTLSGLELFNTISAMTIKDVNGKTIKELDPKAAKFSLGSVKAGVYFLTITAGNKQKVVKLIKE